MKVDYKSFQSKYGEVKKHLSKEVIDAVEETLPVWDMYDDAEFKPSIDDVIELVNGEIANIKEEGEKPAKTAKAEDKPKLSDFKLCSMFLNESQKVVIKKAIEEYAGELKRTESILSNF